MHCSLGNKSETPSQKKKKTRKYAARKTVTKTDMVVALWSLQSSQEINKTKKYKLSAIKKRIGYNSEDNKSGKEAHSTDNEILKRNL